MPEKFDLIVAGKIARIALLEIVHAAKAAHIGSSLSSIEIFLASMTMLLDDDEFNIWANRYCRDLEESASVDARVNREWAWSGYAA